MLTRVLALLIPSSGFLARSSEYFTSAEVMAAPLWKVIPGRMWKVMVSPSAEMSHDSAMRPSRLPSGARVTSGSNTFSLNSRLP